MDSNDEGIRSQPKIVFRNYTPMDPSLDTASIIPDDPVVKKLRKDIDGDEFLQQEKSRNKTILEKALQQAQADLRAHTSSKQSSTVPSARKVNGDLKRDIEKKIQKLERRTQHAIIDLLRERLERQVEQEEDDVHYNLD